MINFKKCQYIKEPTRELVSSGDGLYKTYTCRRVARGYDGDYEGMTNMYYLTLMYDEASVDGRSLQGLVDKVFASCRDCEHVDGSTVYDDGKVMITVEHYIPWGE